MNSKEFLKFQAEQHDLTHQQINLYSRYLKHDPCQGEILYDKETQCRSKLNGIALGVSTATFILKVFSAPWG